MPEEAHGTGVFGQVPPQTEPEFGGDQSLHHRAWRRVIVCKLAQNYGLNDRQLKSAEVLIQKHKEEINAAWRQHFGS